MAGFLSDVLGGIRKVVDVASANINPFKVQVAKQEDYKSLTVKLKEGNLILYRRHGSFDCILANPSITNKVFSVFRLTSETEACSLFGKLFPCLNILLSCTSAVFQEQKLQKICDSARENSSWTIAHVSAYAGLYEGFHHQDVYSCLNHCNTVSRLTPLMTAIMGKQKICVEKLLEIGAQLNIQDAKGNTVYHMAVETFPDVIPDLVVADTNAVKDLVNAEGQTALSMACQKGLYEAVEKLLEAGANPKASSSHAMPIHIAVRADFTKCVELLCAKHQNQLFEKDGKHGGSPLHWAKSKQMVELLCRLGCDVNMVNNRGLTSLHLMLEKDRYEGVMELLCFGADTRLMDNLGNTPLHMAVQKDDAEMVKTLVVFGADVNANNAHNYSPRHMAATSEGRNKESILYILHISGAKRCQSSVKGCVKGCYYEGTYNGTQDKAITTMVDSDKESILDEMLSVLSQTSKAQEAGFDVTDAPCTVGDRVLCLDGGGIRGLVLIQVLKAIEDEAGIPIKDCFDWIGGTSTGGILALGISIDKSLSYLKGLYFRLKDEVFTGSRPYASEPFENMLKREFGETKTMMDIKRPNVFVTGVLGDRFPTELHLFRNYEVTIQRDHQTDDNGVKFEPVPPPKDQLIWRAARCSGAAPTYFRSAGRFIDGGLMANNPTLDMLTEIQEYNTGLKLRNQKHLTRKIACVISVGTGRVPVVPNHHIDVYRPEGLLDVHRVAKGLTGLVATLIDQASVATGRPVDRARAWCSMCDIPFVRLNPRLSEDIPLDCHDNKSLIKMMWETQCYLVANRDRVKSAAEILRKNYRPTSDSFTTDSLI